MRVDGRGTASHRNRVALCWLCHSSLLFVLWSVSTSEEYSQLRYQKKGENVFDTDPPITSKWSLELLKTPVYSFNQVKCIDFSVQMRPNNY